MVRYIEKVEVRGPSFLLPSLPSPLPVFLPPYLVRKRLLRGVGVEAILQG